MYKKSFFSVIALSLLSISIASAEVLPTNNESEDNRDKFPFLRGIADSFKTDVLDKTSAWFEKAKAPKSENTSFYSVLHKFLTGKDSSEEE
jgi:hypothetical protein